MQESGKIHTSTKTTIAADELQKFSSGQQQGRTEDDWWRPGGAHYQLHSINSIRLTYIKRMLCHHFGRNHRNPQALIDMNLLDVGCGGGIVAEPLTRMGARVTGIDASICCIEAAKSHSNKEGLDINYQHSTAEAWVSTGQRDHYDCVLVLELIEHVSDPRLLIESCIAMLRKDGIIFISTINRNFKSFVQAIICAEYILHWLPIGTHNWHKFLAPSEIAQLIGEFGYQVSSKIGMRYNILRNQWQLSRSNTDVNYILMGKNISEQ